MIVPHEIQLRPAKARCVALWCALAYDVAHFDAVLLTQGDTGRHPRPREELGDREKLGPRAARDSSPSTGARAQAQKDKLVATTQSKFEKSHNLSA
jgi:hypothetical protein